MYDFDVLSVFACFLWAVILVKIAYVSGVVLKMMCGLHWSDVLFIIY